MKDAQERSGGSGDTRTQPRRLVWTHHVGGFAARLEDLNGVVGVNVLHGDAVDHHNLVFGAEGQTRAKVGKAHVCKIGIKRKMPPEAW